MTFSAGQTVEAMRFQELDGRGLPLGTLPPAVPLGAECLPTRRVLVKFRVFPRIQPQPIRRQIAATPASQNRRSRGSTCRQSRLAASEAKGRSCAAAFCRLCRNSFKDKHSLFLRSKTNTIRHAATATKERLIRAEATKARHEPKWCGAAAARGPQARGDEGSRCQRRGAELLKTRGRAAAGGRGERSESRGGGLRR